MGLWAQWWTRADPDHLTGPGVIGQNLAGNGYRWNTHESYGKSDDEASIEAADSCIHEEQGITHSVWRVKRTTFDRKRLM
jgi:hypothetical protein